jgi:hypothetical protein
MPGSAEFKAIYGMHCPSRAGNHVYHAVSTRGRQPAPAFQPNRTHIADICHLPGTRRPQLMVRRLHAGEQIAAAGWNLDSGPVFGEVPQPGRFGAFSLKPGCRFRIIGRAMAPSTPRSGGRPGQGI